MPEDTTRPPPGRAATGAHPAEKTGKTQPSECCDAAAKRGRPVATFRQVQELALPKRDEEESWKACERKHPRAPSIKTLFQGDRAAPAVLTFLRETKVGRMITLAPPDSEEGGRRRVGRARPENAPFPLFFVHSFLSPSFLRQLGMEEKGKSVRF